MTSAFSGFHSLGMIQTAVLECLLKHDTLAYCTRRIDISLSLGVPYIVETPSKKFVPGYTSVVIPDGRAIGAPSRNLMNDTRRIMTHTTLVPAGHFQIIL
jgi:hypothetical protein